MSTPCRPASRRRRRPLVESLETRELLAATPAGIAAELDSLPLRFEANEGQTDARVDFVARGRGSTLWLTPSEAVLRLDPDKGPSEVLRMRWLGAQRRPKVVGLDGQRGRSHYFLGKDSARWVGGVSGFGRVAYRGVDPGIDLVFHGNRRRLQYDFIVSLGADPDAISLDFRGARGLAIDREGDLVIRMAAGKIVIAAPVVYQVRGGERVPVEGRYVLQGKGRVGFEIGRYDPKRTLVIDPRVSYATYLGGSLGEQGLAIATDAAGNVYVTGETGSVNFPTTSGVVQPRYSSSGTVTDVFVTKINAAGTAIVYSTYLGGTFDDHGTGIAVDAKGQVYVAGWTSQSFDYPVTQGAFQQEYKRRADGFISKLSADGSTLLYSTFLGGNQDDYIYALAVDGSGHAYVTGKTLSFDFPTQNPLQDNGGDSYDDVFVTKLNPSGSGLVYSTYLRGRSADIGRAIAVDTKGNAYVAGETASPNFPVTSRAFQRRFGGGGSTLGGGGDAFLTKISASGGTLLYSTFFGGKSTELVGGVAVDRQGNAYLVGTTLGNSRQGGALRVTRGAAQRRYGGGLSDAFVAKFRASGSSLVYATYLGGGGRNSSDVARGVGVDRQGNTYVTGTTTSLNFPTKRPFQRRSGGDVDAFVTRINATGSALGYSSFLGGNSRDVANGIAVGASGTVFIVGTTTSARGADRVKGTANNFPTKRPIQRGRPKSLDSHAFVVRIR